MQYTILIFLVTMIVTIFVLIQLLLSRKFGTSNLPPGPKPWPIIGNVHQLGNRPHRTLAELSKIYGPIMSLKLGSITTIIISCPKVAKEMFLKNDSALSSRTIPSLGSVGDHDQLSMIWLPVCPRWRNLRKIVGVHLFNAQRLDARQVLRQEKVNELVQYARHCCETGLAMDIDKAGFTTSLNMMSNTFFSMDLASHVSSDSQEFKDLVWQILREVARPNVSDFFPILKPLDLQGVVKKFSVPFYKLLGLVEKIIDERLKDEKGSKDDVLSTLLKLAKEDELSLDEITRLFMDLFVGGTETASSTLEWAMTELISNPDKMAKAQKEVDQVVGKERSVQEPDIPKLVYIHAVVKETLRLHPPAPLLLPHKAETDAALCGYHVPKNAQIWVNVWSIGRDPSIWRDPLSFEPERFLECEIDVKGRDFELIPFGAGRRICPGLPLAHRMLHLMLASLVHTFNWNHVGPNGIDVGEKFARSLQKAHGVKVVPLPRQNTMN